MSEIRTIDVLDLQGKKAGSVDLPAEVFDVETNIPLMHQVVVAQLAAGRQGTHATKTRGMVSGGGKKPFRQKGTGNARQGSIRAPHFTGGGIVHGPQPAIQLGGKRMWRVEESVLEEFIQEQYAESRARLSHSA